MVHIQTHFRDMNDRRPVRSLSCLVESKEQEMKKYRRRSTDNADAECVRLEDGTVLRQYVLCFYDYSIRKELTLIQHGDIMTCTYDEAARVCRDANVGRKRGTRCAVFPLDRLEEL